MQLSIDKMIVSSKLIHTLEYFAYKEKSKKMVKKMTTSLWQAGGRRVRRVL
jgi:hypothetical protein